MTTLFAFQPKYPPGFLYISDFITEDEERILLTEISQVELEEFVFRGFKANRKIASFGYDYSFDSKSLNKGKDIPPSFDFLIEKVSRHLSLKPGDFAELLVIDYPQKCVLNWHRDAPPFGIIAGISLLSDCIFKLRPVEKDKQTRSSIISIPVKRRSLYVMQGAARSEWQHSVSPVKQARYSITLRTLKNINGDK